MNGNGMHFMQVRSIRRRAEDRIRSMDEAGLPGKVGMADDARAGEPERLIHELQVHQIELEMQNDELRRTSRELEDSRSRYLDLYDFAPVAYFTLGGDGTILEANLTASVLLGVGRVDLIRSSFDRFVLPEDREVHIRRREALLASGEPRMEDLRMLRGNGAPFWANLKAVVSISENGSSVLRVVVSDIDDLKKIGQERDLLISELQAALKNVKVLSGLLPICAWCKKIRDDQGYWNAIEHYLSLHSEAEFTHGICPDCKSRHYGGKPSGTEPTGK